MSEINHNPDILSCLANLSNDEVFTPPEIANAMLDMIPSDFWKNPNVKVFDPSCKSGVFLREAAKRFLKELEEKMPDLQERIDHIFKRMLFGFSITELTAQLSRRSLYCSKTANGHYSITTFKTDHGNILFDKINHTWKNGKCIYCGASEDIYNREEGKETHAYRFIHLKEEKIKELEKMRFDLIISNPPYQLSDGGNGVSATPIFNLFVEQAKKLKPRYLSMIIPARWYAGGKGLDKFRDVMLSDSHIRELVDYESSKDCFDGVNIAGGICYFLWDRDHSGKCKITNMTGENTNIMERSLSEFPILIRSNTAISIVHKVLAKTADMWSSYALPRNPFGFATNYHGREEERLDDIQILTSKGFQYISRHDVKKNTEIIDAYKILIGRLVPSNGELGVNPKDGYKVITDTRIIGPAQINTETYLDIGVFFTKNEALNFDKYIKTKFTRFLLRQAISSLNVTRECFRFVPIQDFTAQSDIDWSKSIEEIDQQLYRKYGLDEKEISFIESSIKPMDFEGDKNE